jgi:hypothetical protein
MRPEKKKTTLRTARGGWESGSYLKLITPNKPLRLFFGPAV